jgi:hypothetical protein
MLMIIAKVEVIGDVLSWLLGAGTWASVFLLLHQ